MRRDCRAERLGTPSYCVESADFRPRLSLIGFEGRARQTSLDLPVTSADSAPNSRAAPARAPACSPAAPPSAARRLLQHLYSAHLPGHCRPEARPPSQWCRVRRQPVSPAAGRVPWKLSGQAAFRSLGAEAGIVPGSWAIRSREIPNRSGSFLHQDQTELIALQRCKAQDSLSPLPNSAAQRCSPSLHPPQRA